MIIYQKSNKELIQKALLLYPNLSQTTNFIYNHESI